MDDHQLRNLRKAARAGLSRANDADTWHRGIETIAKAQQRPDESFEQAYSRVTRDDPDARAMMAMGADAASEAQALRKGGRPREHDPGAVQRGRIEKSLSDAAMQIAQAQGVSYEQGFAKALDTDAGRDLYTALRAMAPEAAE